MAQPPRQHLAHVAILVRDHDEAIAYFVGILDFELIGDTDLGQGKRWALLAPPGSRETRLLLAKAATPRQRARIGDQAGGRVFLFLHTDDFWRDFHKLQARGVSFKEAPRKESYGTVAVFEDLLGNRWDLLEPRRDGPSRDELTRMRRAPDSGAAKSPSFPRSCARRSRAGN